MLLATPLLLLLALTAATPSPNPAPLPDDDTVCPEGTIACGPVCVLATQRCCNDPSTSEFWSCESTQTCGASRKDGCHNPPDKQRNSSPSWFPSPETSRPPATGSHLPGCAPADPATTVSSTETLARTTQTRLSSGDSPFSRPTSTGAGQPPTCFFEVPVVRRVPSEKKGAPCPTSLVSSDTPTEVPTKTGMAAGDRPWYAATVVVAAAGVVALLV
ncbi:hypothetical protein CI238_03075 [Colletotrichum incanum]|uniref:Uncharacterized protein n=1 Tax=Colletotrichum incanum TaxID=1573173 RepID=A0A161VE12_COLIC|nr:hypothetical protein CI238_03075 [Colletotrichum incanum]